MCHSKKFWDTIKKMNNWGEKKTDPCDDIDVKTWVSYFEKLLNDKNSHHVVDVHWVDEELLNLS